MFIALQYNNIFRITLLGKRYFDDEKIKWINSYVCNQ